jgi:hypothetical protein
VGVGTLDHGGGDSSTIQANTIPILLSMTPSYKAEEVIRNLRKFKMEEELTIESRSRNLPLSLHIRNVMLPYDEECDVRTAHRCKCTSQQCNRLSLLT